MNKIELIKAEIKRLKGELPHGASASQVVMETACKEEAYNEVLQFIDSLPEDKPSEDLEKAAESAVNDWLAYGDGKYANLFIAGAQWQKEQMPAEWSEEDEERLIKTAISFLKDFADKGYENAVECIDWLKSKLNGNSCK